MNAVSKMSPVVVPPMFGGGSDDHVTCRMCLIKFSYPARLPLSLNCLHTFCSQCVYSWTCNKTKQKLSCPMCSKVTKLDKGKKVQDCLPVNHAVLELVAISTSSGNGYQNGNVQRDIEVNHALNQMAVSGPQMGIGNEQMASNLFLSGKFNERIQYDSPSNFHQLNGCVGNNIPVGINRLKQNGGVTCSVPAVENSKIYPDLPQGQSNQCNPFVPSPRPQVQPPVSADCGCKTLESARQEKQESTCCGNKVTCPPVTEKPHPVLSINIGSMRFQKREDKDGSEDTTCDKRQESPVRTVDDRRPGAVTELCVNRSPRINKRFSDVPKTACIAKISSDMCVRCNVNPASVTVTNSAQKSVQRLCAECHSTWKEERKNEEQRDYGEGCRRKPLPQDPPNNQARTVVKVQSKLTNGEAARCSPVGEVRARHVESDRKINSSNMQSVLILGDQVRTVAHNTGSCGNQVGVVCGPFKSDQPVTVCSGESSNRCQEGNDVRIACGRTETSAGVIVQRSASDREERNARRNEATTAIDIGTIDQVRVRKTSANTRPNVAPVALIRRDSPNEERQRNTRERPESGFRPREYVVGPSGSVEGRGTVRGGRASEPIISLEELNRPDAFNPQYNESAEYDTRTISSLGLPTVEPVNLMQRATTKEQEALGYSNQQPSNNNGMYPTLSSPPKYEEIMAEANLNGAGGDFIPRFGRYGESSSQPGVFRSPTGVCVSPDDLVIVGDTQNRTVQVFGGHTGECLSLLRVEGLNGCCMSKDGSLVTATNKGVEVYKANGTLSKKVDMGPVINAVAYRNGFVAVQPRALVAFRDLNGTSKTLTEMWKTGQFNQNKPFRNIADMAVNSQQDYIVLDSGSIYTLSDDGCVKFVLKPQNQSSGVLHKPTAIDVDDRNNIIVCDAGSSRVLLFNASGQYLRDIFEPVIRRGLGSVVPLSFGMGRNGKVYIAVKGERRAEVIALSYL